MLIAHIPATHQILPFITITLYYITLPSPSIANYEYALVYAFWL